MAIGKASDFKVYQEEFMGGFVEAVEQETNVFNGASNGAIRLIPNRLKGDYEKESFFKSISGIVSRRDTTSVAAAADLALTQGEFVSVKLNRKIGPVANTLDSFRKIAADPQEFSFILGQQWGKAAAQDYVDTALGGVGAAIAGQASLVNDITGAATKTISHTSMVGCMAKMGDQSSRIVAFVCHSKPFFDLMGAAIADKIFEVAGVTIYAGNVATFNRPTIVTDSASLVIAGAPNTYRTLALVDGAVTVEESETREIVSDMVTGLENLVLRVQGEYGYNVGVKGFQWDIANGGPNPAGAAVLTSGNWDIQVANVKSGPGALLLSE